jgi:hypothetical protein
MLSSMGPPSCLRAAVHGRALCGSRRQLQDYVNHLPHCLNEAIRRALPAGLYPAEAHIEWLSPLESDNYRAYRNRPFLEQLGLGAAADRLSAYWPRLGPCWDGLGLLNGLRQCRREILLVEAKSHVDEVEGLGCRASAASMPLILEAFRETREWLRAEETAAWLGPLYQTANRLAHLHFLRNRLGLPAWLVQVYFLNDPTGTASRADWLPAIAGVHARLGLPSRPPFTVDVFLPALNPE